jgi:hypothetical protein
MANVENRAAEHGSQILSGAGTITGNSGNPIVAIKVLEDATFTAVVAAANTVGADYWVGETVAAGETILGNFYSITISGGVIQGIFS